MTILVTGGAGFIGSNFVHNWLKWMNEPVVVLDAFTYAGNKQNLEWVENDLRLKIVKGDIRDAHLVGRLLYKHAPRAIFHFAAESHVDRSIFDATPFFETNVMGTLVLLQETLNYWITINPEEKERFRFMHVSTDEVYGDSGTDGMFDEDSPYRPNNPYAASKAASNHIVRSFFKTYRLPTITTCSCNTYGPRQHSEKLIPKTIKAALNGDPITVYGSGKHMRDWLHVEDSCSALVGLMQSGKVGEIYNLPGNNEHTNIEVVKSICEILNEEAWVAGKLYQSQIVHTDDRKSDDSRYLMGSKHGTVCARSVSWEEGLRDTVKWYVNQRNERYDD